MGNAHRVPQCTVSRLSSAILFFIVVASALALPSLVMPATVRVAAIAASLGATVRLYRRDRAVFVPALFFAIHAVLAPGVFAGLARLPFQLPQLSFLPAMVVYLVVVLRTPMFRQHLHWLRRGEFSWRVVARTVVLVAGSAAALVLWAINGDRDFSAYRSFVPSVGLPVLIAYGLLFASANAVFEEFLARALLYDGFAALAGRVGPAIVAQAIVFALWHFNGFPGGWIGVTLVFLWSLLLGVLRHLSRGMAAPLVAHFFADATIALILLAVVVVP